MNIVMMTNTYKPILGGLEKSVEIFTEEYRKRGHKVLIVAPEFDDTPKKEKGVFRVPSLKKVGDTDFSVELPISLELNKVLEKFKPDIIHTHHPFLIGDTALRASCKFDVPIVFTNHTLYAENTHYLPGGKSKVIKKFVVKLAKGYANLCDQVIAPSQSVVDLLRKGGVKTPIEALPTGIYLDDFKKGNGKTFRKFFDIPLEAFVVGIIGRMAPEKNILFLSKAVAAYLKKNKNAYFVVVGSGPSLDKISQIFKRHKLESRLVCTGVLRGNQLISAYKALDVFAFSSHSETQGLVLVEAMAAGTPVVGVNAPGVRDVIEDKINGRIISSDDVNKFVDSLYWIACQSPQKLAAIKRYSKKTAKEYSVDICVNKALQLYKAVIKDFDEKNDERDIENSQWNENIRSLKAQVELMANTSRATAEAVVSIPVSTVKRASKRFRKAIHDMTA